METFRFTDRKMIQIVKIWKELANENGGKFNNILCTSPAAIDPINNKLRRFELKIPSVHDSQIVFTTSEKHPLKVKYEFQKQLDFEFQIYPEDLIEKVFKLFGAREVQIGLKEFDNKFILKSNNQEFMKYILDQRNRDFLSHVTLSSINLRSVKNSEFEIVLVIHEHVKEEMQELLDFVGRMINRILEWAE